MTDTPSMMVVGVMITYAALWTYKKSGKWSLKDAVQQVTKEHNLSRSVVYRLALNVWK